MGRAYNEDGSLTLSATEDSSSAFSINPLGSLNNKTKDIRAKVITNNVLEVKFPFIKGLSYKLNTGFTYQNSSYKNYQGLDTYEGASANGVLNTETGIQKNGFWRILFLINVNLVNIVYFSQDYILLKARNMNRIHGR